MGCLQSPMHVKSLILISFDQSFSFPFHLCPSSITNVLDVQTKHYLEWLASQDYQGQQFRWSSKVPHSLHTPISILVTCYRLPFNDQLDHKFLCLKDKAICFSIFFHIVPYWVLVLKISNALLLRCLRSYCYLCSKF